MRGWPTQRILKNPSESRLDRIWRVRFHQRMIVAGVKNTHRTWPGASFALVCVVCAIATPLQAATPVVPDERDRQVLETLLLHLLADPKFDMTRVSTNG